MKTPDESWRLFIAIELPPSLQQTVGRHIASLRSRVPAARASWTREENLHLTLKFLGDTPVSKVKALSEAMRLAANGAPSFDLIVGRCGAFPPDGQPRVLWIGIEDLSGNLNQYHRALEDECAKVGFSREERPFHPHLTIARLRQPHDSRRLAELHHAIAFSPVSVKARDVCLIRSELRSEGSRYTVISRHDLLVR